jgi:hypothetical protein
MRNTALLEEKTGCHAISAQVQHIYPVLNIVVVFWHTKQLSSRIFILYNNSKVPLNYD